MNVSPPVSGSFERLFCEQYDVRLELYAATVLRLTLYPHARWLADASPRNFLAVDRRLITSVGRLTRWSQFAAVAHEFQREAVNDRFWRRHLCLCISIDRMRVLFSDVMGGISSKGPSGSRLGTQDHGPSDSFATD